jgi:hypothetical protein
VKGLGSEMDMEEFGSELDFVSVAVVDFMLVAMVGEANSRVVVRCKCGRVGGGVRK